MQSIKLSKAIILFLISLSLISSISAQVTTPFNSGGGGEYVGWDVSMLGTPLDILTTAPDDINFSTGSALRMNILGNTGFVGIGSNLGAYTPAFFLDVQNQININFSGASPINTFGIGYYIGGEIQLFLLS